MTTPISPLLASGALQFAFERATLEGKITIGTLVVVSMFSWTVIVSKIRQVWIANRVSRRFYKAWEAVVEPRDLAKTGVQYKGAPAYSVYRAAMQRLEQHLAADVKETGGRRKITESSFDMLKSSTERAVGVQAMSLEKGMIVLSTAVSGGPFIGLLGTVWGVMETFSGIAKANAASLTAMAPGVAGALIATVIGLLVAIPAMFAYNFLVTTIRNITHDVDSFTAELVTLIAKHHVERGSDRPVPEAIPGELV